MIAKMQHKTSKTKVLYVEDDSDFRNQFRLLLAVLGFTDVDIAIDGQAAWMQFYDSINGYTKQKYGLIITDYDLPLLDGTDLISLIKKHTKFPPPCIVMTKHTILASTLQDILNKEPKCYALDKQIVQKAMEDLDEGPEFFKILQQSLQHSWHVGTTERWGHSTNQLIHFKNRQ